MSQNLSLSHQADHKRQEKNQQESQSDVLSRTQETTENQKELRRNQSENNSNITEDQLGEISRAADVEVNHISAPDWYVNKIPTPQSKSLKYCIY